MADLDCKAGPELPADASAVALPPRESAVNAHGSTNGSAVAIVEEEAAHGAYAVPAVARHPVAAEPAAEVESRGGDLPQGLQRVARRLGGCSIMQGKWPAAVLVVHNAGKMAGGGIGCVLRQAWDKPGEGGGVLPVNSI